MESTVKLCDKCQQQPAAEYKLWQTGDKTATTVDLCATHAKSLLQIFEIGRPEELPPKPRAKMEIVKLKPTSATRQHKKKTPPRRKSE